MGFLTFWTEKTVLLTSQSPIGSSSDPAPAFWACVFASLASLAPASPPLAILSAETEADEFALPELSEPPSSLPPHAAVRPSAATASMEAAMVRTVRPRR